MGDVAVTLRRPTAEEFELWWVISHREYVEEIVASGLMSRESAEEKSTREEAEDMPDGLETPGHLIYRVEADGHTVGWLWVGLSDRRRPQAGSGFIYDISIDEPFRGRGYGRATMRAAEDEARKHGLRALALNVFGQNSVARALYASLGYRETSVHMRKEL